MLDVLLADIYYVSFGGNRYIPVWLPNHGKQEGIHPSPDMKCCYSVIKGLTVTQGVLDSHVGLLLVVLSVVRADTHVIRGWREPGNSIKDPGMARTGIGFLVLLLYENT